MVIDGSDIGLGSNNSADIDAVHRLIDGTFLFSFVGAPSIPDVGAVDDSDIVHFIPASLGTTTSGTFEFYFDGSDVGLSNNGEDVDAIQLLANGDLILSTSGSFNVPGVSGADEDLVRFSPTSLGTSTSGTWSAYFDGSDVDLNTSSSEDVWGVWIDESSGNIYLTTSRSFVVTGLSGEGEDIFTCDPGSLGSTTSCDSFSMYWDGSIFGYAGELMDGMTILRP